MKKSIILGLSVIALAVNLTSCKKGENDPFLSLSSRKARLAGEWTLTNETNNDVYNGNNGVNDYIQTTASIYDGTTRTGTETTVTNGQIATDQLTPQVYTQQLTIEKDGTFILSYISADGSEKYEGNWVFLGKNKSTKLKNKEAISLSFSKFTSTDADGVTTTSSAQDLDGWIFAIDQLKKKEIVLIDESSNTNSQGKVNSNITVSTYTLK